jgi:hypothetical protein
VVIAAPARAASFKNSRRVVLKTISFYTPGFLINTAQGNYYQLTARSWKASHAASFKSACVPSKPQWLEDETQ